MDWKKENISASELDRREKEYMSAALAMMKQARPAVMPEPVREPAAAEPVVQAVEAAPPEVPEKPVIQAKVTAEVTAEVTAGITTNVAVTADTAAETSEDTAEPQTEDGADEKYGVYTAEELLNGEHRGDGLKKAAEILEEMTRSTEMMKRLAEGNEPGDDDTTDFPDFSCGDSGTESSFREESGPESETQGKCPPDDE